MENEKWIWQNRFKKWWILFLSIWILSISLFVYYQIINVSSDVTYQVTQKPEIKGGSTCPHLGLTRNGYTDLVSVSYNTYIKSEVGGTVTFSEKDRDTDIYSILCSFFFTVCTFFIVILFLCEVGQNNNNYY